MTSGKSTRKRVRPCSAKIGQLNRNTFESGLKLISQKELLEARQDLGHSQDKHLLPPYHHSPRILSRKKRWKEKKKKEKEMAAVLQKERALIGDQMSLTHLHSWKL